MFTPYGAVSDGPTMVARGANSGGTGAGSYGSYTGGGGGGVHPYANYAVIGWFVIAALGIYLLDRGGFRFVITSTKR